MEQKDIEKFQAEAQACAEPLGRIKIEMGRVIAGQDQLIDRLLLALVADGHVLLEGVPGLAKTLAVKTLAQTLSGTFSRLQFTPDLLPADVIGTRIYNAETHEFSTRIGPVFANIVLADEINRTSSKTQSALLEAMEEHRVTVDGQTYDLPTPFVVLATQNPTGSAGTTLLPSSQLDRFLIRLSMGYPDHRSQINILRDRHSENPLNRVQPVVTKDELLQLIQEARTVEANDRIFDYVTTLAEATRTHPMVELGVSPRGALALCRMAKAHAFLAGRDFVVPEDVAAVFPDVCAHRLILSAKARMMEEKAENILAEILKSVDMPVLKA